MLPHRSDTSRAHLHRTRARPTLLASSSPSVHTAAAASLLSLLMVFAAAVRSRESEFMQGRWRRWWWEMGESYPFARPRFSPPCIYLCACVDDAVGCCRDVPSYGLYYVGEWLCVHASLYI